MKNWFSLLSFLAILSATAGEFAFHGSTALEGGYQSNVYQSPDILDTGTGSFNPVTSSSLSLFRARLAPLYNWNQAHRLTMRYNLDAGLYAADSKLNEYTHEGSLEYWWKLRKTLALKLEGNLQLTRQHGTSATGDELATLYNYRQIEIGPKVEFRPLSWLDAGAAYLYTNRDYEEPDSSAALDYGQQRGELTLAPRLGKTWILKAQVTYARRSYRELPSYDTTGHDSSVYPSRAYDYLSLPLRLGAQAGGFTAELGYTPSWRTDRFEDYYSYQDQPLSLDLAWERSKTTRIEASGGWKKRSYPVHTAYRPGPNPLLVMYYYQAGLEGRQQIWGPVFLTGGYEYSHRTTNTGYNTYLQYREYTDHRIQAGVLADW